MLSTHMWSYGVYCSYVYSEPNKFGFEDVLKVDWTSSLHKLIETIAFPSSYINGEYESKE
jgi:hypothetical protein